MIEKLNNKQLEAVEIIDKNLLIIAGPGAGKTKTIINKIAYLIDNGVKPYNILALTFTNKAAKEMNERLNKLSNGKSKGILLTTFHSFALRMLKIYPLEKYGKDFTIYDERDSLSLIKDILNGTEEDLSPNEVLSLISLIKDEMIEIERANIEPNLRNIYKSYQKRLLQAKAMDFGDLILNLIKKTKNNDFGELLSNKYKYIIVDEFQDTNIAQYELLKHISKNSIITAVGDEDQSIYGWRGAEIDNILKFPKEFKAKIIKLGMNYRSAKKIVEYSQNLIKHNTLRYNKEIIVNKKDEGTFEIFDFTSDKEEARFIATKIKDLIDLNNIPPKEIAVFYRVNSQSKLIEDFLRGTSVPYKLIGDVAFYQRKEIKDIIYFLKLATNNNDIQAFRRIINVPPRGIGKTTVEIIIREIQENDLELEEFMKTLLFNQSLAVSKKYKIMEFWNSIQSIKDLNIKSFENFLQNIGYMEYLQKEDRKKNTSKVDNVQRLIEELRSVDNMQEWLDYVSLSSDEASKDDNAVSLMTLHSSKGLEFEYCFIIGAVDGLIPNLRDSLYSNYNDIFQKQGNIELKEYEEERRLFYVGITRAKKGVYITYSYKRMINGKITSTFPSPFLKELSMIKKETYIIQKKTKTKKETHKIKSNKRTQRLKDYGYQKGMIVEHPTYGKGEILLVTSSLDDQKLVIYFPGIGKKVMSGSLAPLKKRN